MTKRCVGVFETQLWDTADGSLGSGFYGNAGLSPDGQALYFVETPDKKKSPNQVGDLTSTSDQKDIKGKALANSIGVRYLSDFYDDSDKSYSRQTETKAKLDKMKSSKGEAPPTSRTFQGAAR